MTCQANNPPSPENRPAQFHGLFIGIDQYASIEISNLASAVRDAEALHAVFTDNLGDNTTLLTDSEATTQRLRDELDALTATSSAEDVVVISFSGHGSDSHELVTYDTDIYDLSGSALPLSEFTERISAIPAKHLLVVLDCCFSGGAGAKVLHAPRLSRGGAGGLPLSTEALLNQMAGTGRVILTAATADQEAWEDPRLGHGYLSYYLLEALLGSEAVATDGQIHLLDLLKYVITQVTSSASGAHAARQEPTIRGSWDGDVIWPVFQRGPRYDAMYPPTRPAPVTADIGSLANYRLPPAVIEAWSATLPTLNQLQQDAINEGGVFEGRNILVMAPTSSGKTMIGELAALRASQTGGRSVFLLPTKALVNEQYERFRRIYGPIGVRVVRATGDHKDEVPALLRGQFDLAIFTYEKFSGLVLAQPHLLRLVSVVVVDEVQTIVDRSRGRDLELLLTIIKSRTEEGLEPQLIALSAVLGNINGLDSWLEAYLLKSDHRPVPLDEGLLTQRGQYHFRDADGAEQSEEFLPAVYGEPRARTLLIPLVHKLVQAGQQVIVVRGIRGEARGAASYLASSLGLPPAARALAQLPDGDPTQSTVMLRQCLQGGVAFHIADLGPEERRIVEEEFRQPNSEIRVVVATTTLAQGVNLPAETVIMPELSRFRGHRRPPDWYSVAEYKNIAGRAGRLGLTDRGRSIVLAFDQATYNRVWQFYVNGSPEDVNSQLLDPQTDLYTVVLRVAALAVQRSDDSSTSVADLVAVLASSFAAHQARLAGASDAFAPARIEEVVGELREVGFLEITNVQRARLAPLGALVASSMLSVQSAVRVTNALRQAHPSQLTVPTMLAAVQLTNELDEVLLTVNGRGVRAELTTFLGALQSRGVAASVLDGLGRAPDQIVVAARAKKALACLLWVNGVPLGEIERFVMQHYFDRNASGPIGNVTSRAHDVIETVIDISAELHPTADLQAMRTSLPVQLELGIPENVVGFALAGAELRREDYLRLNSAGFISPTSVIDPTDDVLLPLLGHSTARLSTLRRAASKMMEVPPVPRLEDLLPEQGSVPASGPLSQISEQHTTNSEPPNTVLD